MLFNPAPVLPALVLVEDHRGCHCSWALQVEYVGWKLKVPISCCRHCYSETAEDVFFQLQASMSAFYRDQHLILSVTKLPG